MNLKYESKLSLLNSVYWQDQRREPTVKRLELPSRYAKVLFNILVVASVFAGHEATVSNEDLLVFLYVSRFFNVVIRRFVHLMKRDC